MPTWKRWNKDLASLKRKAPRVAKDQVALRSLSSRRINRSFASSYLQPYITQLTQSQLNLDKVVRVQKHNTNASSKKFYLSLQGGMEEARASLRNKNSKKALERMQCLRLAHLESSWRQVPTCLTCDARTYTKLRQITRWQVEMLTFDLLVDFQAFKALV